MLWLATSCQLGGAESPRLGQTLKPRPCLAVLEQTSGQEVVPLLYRSNLNRFLCRVSGALFAWHQSKLLSASGFTSASVASMVRAGR